MLKKLLMLCVALVLLVSAGWAAAVEVNTADQTTLESVKGIGPAHAKAIIDERTKNGPFKNADDLASRVKGLGTKSVTNFEAAGLTINGASTPPGGAKTSTKATSTAAGKPAAPPATAATAAPAMAGASAPAGASGTKPSKSKKSKGAASAATASAPAAGASSPAEASGTQGAKTKKAKKSKAASATAASGT